MNEPFAPPPIQGSCLCGSVRYSLTSGLGTSIICWCENCKKATGSLCMANSFIDRKSFKLLTPSSPQEPPLRVYTDNATDSGGTILRYFCEICGSNLFVENTKRPDKVIVASGTMDCRAAGVVWSPDTEVYTKRKPGWVGVELEERRVNGPRVRELFGGVDSRSIGRE